MPIRPDLKKFYSGPEWAATRRRILERAGHACEQCGKKAGHRVYVFSRQGMQFWTYGGFFIYHWTRCSDREHFTTRELMVMFPDLWRPDPDDDHIHLNMRLTRCVLTIAHLNHQAGDDRDENLKALCQWCHLNYDKPHHAETRATRKDGGRPLLALS